MSNQIILILHTLNKQVQTSVQTLGLCQIVLVDLFNDLVFMNKLFKIYNLKINDINSS